MILSEAHALQISAILIEAAEEQGDTQSLISRVKNFFGRLVNGIKDRISKLGNFLGEKLPAVKSMLDKVGAALSKVSKEYKNQKAEFNIAINARILKILKEWPKNLEKATKELDKVIKNPDLTNRAKQKQINQLVRVMEEAIISIPSFTGVQEGVGKKEDKKVVLKSYKEVAAAMNLLKDTVKDMDGITRNYVKRLEYYKGRLEKFTKQYDGEKISFFTAINNRIDQATAKLGISIIRAGVASALTVKALFGGTKKVTMGTIMDDMEKKAKERQEKKEANKK